MSLHTVRYYDKEGLIPFIERSKKDIRFFSERDLEGLEIINCLKVIGMPIKEIRNFMDWCMEGDVTLKKRYEMFIESKKIVQAQIKELEKGLDRIDYKC